MDISKYTEIDNTQERIYALANCIEQTLLARGYIIHRKEAVTTNSIYIKVDYGVGGSIRISDHKGKSSLKYRFNLEAVNETGSIYTSTTDYGVRYFYSYAKLEEFIIDIIKFREYRVTKYNRTCGYAKIVEKEKKKAIEETGFWHGAYEIQLSNSNRIKVWLRHNKLEENMMDSIVEVVRERNERLDGILQKTKGGWKGLPKKHLDLIIVRYKELLDNIEEQ